MNDLVNEFCHASPLIQSLLSGNPATGFDDNFFELIMGFGALFILALILLFIVVIMSLSATENGKIATSMGAIFLGIVLPLSIYIPSDNVRPGTDEVIKSFITPGREYDKFSLIQPFKNYFWYGADVVPVNKQAMDEINDNLHSESFVFPRGVIVGLDKKNRLYRIYFKDELGGLWRSSVQRFVWEQVIEHPKLDTPSLSAPSFNEKDIQKDFQNMKH